jgi:uncharacterized protein YndB with AHSA1/START domain
MAESDSIQKRLLLHVPKERVWCALSDSTEFGAWFGVALEGPFEAGRTVKGRITYPGYEHVTMEVVVERMDSGKLFSYRWHPYAIEPGVDYSHEPTTLVEFRLAETADGTMLTLTESGFSQIPAHRRTEAFRMNDSGWTEQMGNIKRHVAG